MDSKAKNLPGNDRLQVVSNFGDGDCGAGEIHTRAREILAGCVSSKFRACAVYFARPTIAIAKIRDYSQSKKTTINNNSP